MPANHSTSAEDTSATIRFETKLWPSADKLRNNMDVAEYNHFDLGLVFLKYISGTFEEHRDDYAQASALQRKPNNAEMAPPLLK